MNHVPIKLGPLALLLTVVVICLSVLAILTFTTAQADLTLARYYAETVQTRYELEEEGQRFLLQAKPKDAMVFEKDGMRLTVALDETGAVIRWTLEKQWTQPETTGNLWMGS